MAVVPLPLSPALPLVPAPAAVKNEWTAAGAVAFCPSCYRNYRVPAGKRETTCPVHGTRLVARNVILQPLTP